MLPEPFLMKRYSFVSQSVTTDTANPTASGLIESPAETSNKETQSVRGPTEEPEQDPLLCRVEPHPWDHPDAVIECEKQRHEALNLKLGQLKSKQRRLYKEDPAQVKISADLSKYLFASCDAHTRYKRFLRDRDGPDMEQKAAPALTRSKKDKKERKEKDKEQEKPRLDDEAPATEPIDVHPDRSSLITRPDDGCGGVPHDCNQQ